MKKNLLFFFALITAGCSSNVFYELPVEFKNSEKRNDFISKYSPYFAGKKFFIDPGHGGEDRRSVGPGELVVEADANLNVALALKDYLIRAGALVEMSRETDMTVDLKERSYMANRSGADFFISVHHNAPGPNSDRGINYTSTYYHAKETDYEYEPMERDLAKYIQRDLAYAMRNSGGLGSFDGTYSDYWIYPGAGFSVLRLTEIPSILVECGFFTNEYEEKKLAIPEFNKIQGWGIFRGIARYLSAGIPKVEFLNETDVFAEGDLQFEFAIIDSVEIDISSIEVMFDSIYVKDYLYEQKDNSLFVPIPNVAEGNHSIRVIAANKNGNHTLPFHREIIVINKK